MSSSIPSCCAEAKEVKDCCGSGVGAPAAAPVPYAIRVQDLSKMYKIFARPQDRLLQMLNRGRKKLFREFWAVQNLSFEIEKGSTVGIMGRNGAGKSTLLQIICGTLAPTVGEVDVAGRISALLELGTGFNSEFTGKENVYLNGAILGLSREEIDAKYEDILAFADIGAFIDQPVKTYSSGMVIRLAFAVAVNVEPEILIVDEALSVGDVKFQAKCFKKFQEFRKAGKTILLVSHSPEEIVRHCSRALLLEGGCLLADGKPKDVANQYLDLMFGVKPEEKSLVLRRNGSETGLGSAAKKQAATQSEESLGGEGVKRDAADDGWLRQFIDLEVCGDNVKLRSGYNKGEYRWGDKRAEIIDYMLCSEERYHVNHFHAEELVELYIKVKFHADVAKPIYGLTLKTPDGVTIYGTNSRDWNGRDQYVGQRAGDIAVIRFAIVPRLITGHYLISLGVVEQQGEDVLPLDRRYDLIETYITNTKKSFGLADLGMSVSVVS